MAMSRSVVTKYPKNYKRSERKPSAVEQLKGNLEALEDQLVFSPEELESYVKAWKNGFHQYSLRNYLLAFIQCPQTSILANYRKWLSEGRCVLKGQKAIKILVPVPYKRKNTTEDKDEFGLYFKTGNTFDISQTGIFLAGKAIKERTVGIPRTGETIQYLYDEPQEFKADSLSIGGPQNAKNHGTLTLDDLKENLPEKIIMDPKTEIRDGWTDFKDIHITDRKNEPNKIAVGFHEKSHIQLGHKNTKISRELQELEAEACSYVVCRYFGIENPDAAKYIQNWKGNKELLKGRGKHIIKAAQDIINLFEVKED